MLIESLELLRGVSGVSDFNNQDIRKGTISWVRFLILLVLSVWVVNNFFFVAYRVNGTSMEPTLDSNDMLVVDKSALWQDRISRFDVVVFHHDKKDDYVKRVIGLPGDKIEYKNDVLYVNGKKVPESYLVGELGGDARNGVPFTGNFTLDDLLGSKTVPEDMYFVLGDNRLVSKDSRMIGFVSKDTLVGKVAGRYYPLNAIKFDMK